jgi:hypothetical protein
MGAGGRPGLHPCSDAAPSAAIAKTVVTTFSAGMASLAIRMLSCALRTAPRDRCHVGTYLGTPVGAVLMTAAAVRMAFDQLRPQTPRICQQEDEAPGTYETGANRDERSAALLRQTQDAVDPVTGPPARTGRTW